MKVLIIEDEPQAIKRLEKLLLEIDATIKVVERISRVEKAIEWFYENADIDIDLVLMDIQLSDGISFEIFNSVKVNYPAVFTTAYDEFAIQAIKVNALDYLLKPVKKAELESVLEKCMSKKEAEIKQVQNAKWPQPKYKSRFVIRLGNQIKLIKIEEVAFFYTESKLTFIVTFTGKKYPMDDSLDALEHLLEPAQFYRANRQYILNINAIDEMVRYSKSRVKVSLKPKEPFDLIVSTEKSSNFKVWLSGDKV